MRDAPPDLRVAAIDKPVQLLLGKGIPQPEADGDYAVFIEQSWLTNRAISNKTAEGFTVTFADAAPIDLDELGKDMYKLVADEMLRLNGGLAGEGYHDGWTNVLGEPEFAESDTARRALRVLEERPLLEDLLSQTVQNSEVGGVQVLIGGEGNWEELRECSLVLARYGAPELATGILALMDIYL